MRLPRLLSDTELRGSGLGWGDTGLRAGCAAAGNGRTIFDLFVKPSAEPSSLERCRGEKRSLIMNFFILLSINCFTYFHAVGIAS